MRIRIISLLFLIQPFFACQKTQDMGRPLTANVDFTTVKASLESPVEAVPSAINVVFRSVDGGQTWQDVSAGLPFAVEIGSIYAGKGEVFLGSEDGIYRSKTGSDAPNWENDFLLDKRISQIFPGRDGPYASSYGNGFFKEIPGTGVWVPMHNALADKRIHSVLELPDGTLIVACDSGIYKSADGGDSWKQVFDEGMASSLVAADGVLIAGGFRGVLRSTDDGEHWNWVLTEGGAAFNAGLIKGGIAAITFDGGTTQQLRTSMDNGITWQLRDDNLPLVRFLSDIKQSGEYQFCPQDKGIFRSSDQGKTWELVLPSKGKRMYHLAVSGQVVFAIVLAGC